MSVSASFPAPVALDSPSALASTILVAFTAVLFAYSYETCIIIIIVTSMSCVLWWCCALDWSQPLESLFRAVEAVMSPCSLFCSGPHDANYRGCRSRGVSPWCCVPELPSMLPNQKNLHPWWPCPKGWPCAPRPRSAGPQLPLTSTLLAAASVSEPNRVLEDGPS